MFLNKLTQNITKNVHDITLVIWHDLSIYVLHNPLLSLVEFILFSLCDSPGSGSVPDSLCQMDTGTQLFSWNMVEPHETSLFFIKRNTKLFSNNFFIHSCLQLKQIKMNLFLKATKSVLTLVSGINKCNIFIYFCGPRVEAMAWKTKKDLSSNPWSCSCTRAACDIKYFMPVLTLNTHIWSKCWRCRWLDLFLLP